MQVSGILAQMVAELELGNRNCLSLALHEETVLHVLCVLQNVPA